MLLAACVVPARADREVLAPRGLIVPPGAMRLEYLIRNGDRGAGIGWATVGLPESFLGIEVEAERSTLSGGQRETLSAQYSLTGNAFSDIAPALSLGMRDVLNRGREGRALFGAATKTFRLSLEQERVVREWRLTLGLGTNRLGGGYIGVEGKFTAGFSARVEYLARRVNSALSVPVGRHWSLQSYTLDGALFYGASFTLAR